MIQAYVLNSASEQVCKIDSPLFLEARVQQAEYQAVFKAVSEPPSRGSKRLREAYGTTIDGVACASRPFDLALYAYAATVNTYNARAVAAKAKDIVGRPWRIVGDGPTALKDRITKFFRCAFGQRSFSKGMGCVWQDREALGNGYLEVIPNGINEPAELAHVPAPEVWIRLDGLGFVQQQNGFYAHFRAFGVDAAKYSELPAKDPLNSAADRTSLIHWARYSPWSPYYGIPAVMPAWSALALMSLVGEYNLQFFSNNAIPDYAVILEGEVAEDASDTIREYFRRHLKGQAHKTLVLEMPNGAKIRFERLTSDAAKEGAFRLLRQDCRDEILQAHGVPPQKVGVVETGKLGGNLATEQIREYKDSVIVPGQEDVSSVLNRLIESGFSTDQVRFEFEPYDLDDRKLNADVDAIYLDRYVVTSNEVRALRYPGLEPLEGGDQPLKPATLGELSGLNDAVEKMQGDIANAVRGAR